MAAPRTPATHLPVARVLPLLGLVHLDKLFDYQVAEADSEAMQPGVRVRLRFGGRLVDGLVYDRVASAEHEGNLRYVDRVISPEPVLTPVLKEIIERVAQRYGATRSDILRAAIPPRHAGAEKSDFSQRWQDLGKREAPDLSAWSSYVYGESFVDHVLGGGSGRAAWQIAPGDNWAEALAALAVAVASDGGGALIVVPDAKRVAQVEKALRVWVSAAQVTVLGSDLGPQARYRRFLSILHGQGKIVVGTRSAAYAPVQDLRLTVVMFDGDDNLTDPRAPYVHAREVITTRAVVEGCAVIIGGYARTAETQLLVEEGWAHDLVASRDTVRTRLPWIQAVADTDFVLQRDPNAGGMRLPGVAFQAVREALAADKPVLVHTPRKGYIPTLACGSCRTPARCRSCNGPLELPQSQQEQPGVLPTCRWCGRPDTHFRCMACGSDSLRAVVLGSERTAEELGRAFAGVPVIVSGGSMVKDSVPQKGALVVATPGAEPLIDDGDYGAALILDTWALLGRQDLRATEDTLARWMDVATLVASHREGGRVIVAAEPDLAVVQEFLRWDPVGAARRELAQREEVGFPPAVHMAAVDGAARAVEDVIEHIELPEGADVLGPVDLPPGIKLPGEYDEAKYGPPQRVLIRVARGPRSQLGSALKAAASARIARKEDLPLRIQIDPVNVG
ncbi:primosome assembly protein PriA [Corynebacterium renale]|uniref:primosomal protein N' n=1 Tax=Corynebacterium renale TaxID=1724 RepID=UPI000DA3B4B9|nr:primosomal protein N' [Corynebacterium renale]SQG64753.1 primosome assembly protein PriA [Corynebacterium renale]